ncbi:MAG: aminodeoxychorismate synthase component I [Pelagimonas sp.]|jgi:para-aminobenzoate synthetase component 1|nr:aminodeoxychorismate synthase component I [Pelagimonas sp.]
MKISFDHGPAGTESGFANPTGVIRADSPAEVPAALAALDRARADGAWLAGFCSYELGYALEPKLAQLMPQERALPLLMFGVYDAPCPMPQADPGGALLDIHPNWDEARYAQAFERLHAYIGAGDTYQANLTFPLSARLTGEAAALYATLARKQAVRYGALVEADGLPTLLSRSPELFFATDTAGRIETRPMKGTQPRDADPVRDAANAAFLKADEKNQAENLMIVDLLRNDISRICQPGSVKVPDLFKVESYATVHQMVSTVEGQMLPGTQLSDILRALFPCGSITGAPKVRAMEIIAELEETPRNIYCGSIGWAAPDGRSEFNVAIRTLTAQGQDVTLNVGGGVVHDSTAASEYEEALWKTRFARMNPVSA